MGVPSYTLFQFTNMVGNAIRRSPELQNAWVLAELSDFRVGSGGHAYMELIEKNAQGATVAKLRANMWANRVGYVMQKFQAVTGRPLASGLKVMLCGSASFHASYGLSFNVIDIDPSFTLGDMERIRREILDRLQREGILGMQRSLPLPMTPQRVAVISSATAAGYGDFVNQLNSNSGGYVFYTHLVAATMQGDGTSASVRAALDFVESTVDLWDMVVIIRGGGATTDLNGFDDYDLARRVATFPLPIAVGIGHERDRTVLDEIAAVRCKTPTAVAAWLIESLDRAWVAARDLSTSISRLATELLNAEQQRLGNLQAMLPIVAGKRISDARTLLHQIASRLPSIARDSTRNAFGHLQQILATIPMVSDSRIFRERTRLDTLSTRLRTLAEGSLSKEGLRLEALDGMVKALAPENTLRRGFSITLLDGKAVTSPGQVAPGTKIVTRTADGEFNSTVN